MLGSPTLSDYLSCPIKDFVAQPPSLSPWVLEQFKLARAFAVPLETSGHLEMSPRDLDVLTNGLVEVKLLPNTREGPAAVDEWIQHLFPHDGFAFKTEDVCTPVPKWMRKLMIKFASRGLPPSKPYCLRIREYIANIIKVGQALQELSRDNHPLVLTLRRDRRGGDAEGYGDWSCKSHMWTFLFVRQFLPPNFLQAPLLLLDMENLKLPSMDTQFLQALMTCSTPRLTCPKGNKVPVLWLIHFFDGIYSGGEADIFLSDLEQVSQRLLKRGLNVVTRVLTPAVYEVHYEREFTTDPTQAKDFEHFASVYYPHNFVLPFKIADHISLGSASTTLHDLNPAFIEPYRRGVDCHRKHEDQQSPEDIDHAELFLRRLTKKRMAGGATKRPSQRFASTDPKYYVLPHFFGPSDETADDADTTENETTENIKAKRQKTHTVPRRP